MEEFNGITPPTREQKEYMLSVIKDLFEKKETELEGMLKEMKELQEKARDWTADSLPDELVVLFLLFFGQNNLGEILEV